MVRKIRVSSAFIKQRDKNAEKYVSRGRSSAQMKLACQHELFEFDMIHKGEWKSGDSWKVDGIDPTYGRIEVKHCPGPYLFTPNAQKTAVQRQQIGHVENFCAIKRLSDEKVLVAGDIVEIKVIGFFPFEETMNRMVASSFNSGHYIRLECLLNTTKPILGIKKSPTAYNLKRKAIAKLMGITQKEASEVMKFTNQLLKRRSS